jgi:zinc/manganese transport system substrate-binding protein
MFSGAVVFLSGCAWKSSPAGGNGNGASGSPGGKIRIVSAESFYGEAAQAVGGDKVEVVSVLNRPGTDPHEFEPTPEVSRAVSRADLVLYNGLGYDDWMAKLIGASGRKTAVIKVGEDVMGRHNGDNEHVWYDPDTMTRLAASLADKLSGIDPGSADEYRARAKEYQNSLEPFRLQVSRLKQKPGIRAAVSEPVFDDMLKALNIGIANAGFAKAIGEGTDPSPADLAALQEDLRNKRVRLFVNNIQSASPTVENLVRLAGQNGIPVLEVTETAPAGKTYPEWMTDTLNRLEAALK